MHDYYNVTGLLVTPLAMANILAKLVNCLVKGLNDHIVLPCFVIMLPDSDIVNYITHFSAGTTLLSSTAIDWIARQMSRAVMSKKEFLRRKKPGSITRREPKFIWLKMLLLPDSTFES